MIFAIAFGVLGLAFVGLNLYERRRGGTTSSTERDLYAMKDGAAFGNVIGQAQMHKLGVSADQITVREDTEPVKFKFED
jgi:hypothetical protein